MKRGLSSIHPKTVITNAPARISRTPTRRELSRAFLTLMMPIINPGLPDLHVKGDGNDGLYARQIQVGTENG